MRMIIFILLKTRADKLYRRPSSITVHMLIGSRLAVSLWSPHGCRTLVLHGVLCASYVTASKKDITQTFRHVQMDLS